MSEPAKLYTPSDRHRREVRRILRSGERSAAWRVTHARRFLAGCRLLGVLDDVAWLRCTPRTQLAYAMQYFHYGLCMRTLRRESPLWAMMRGTYRPTYGAWR